MEGLSPKEQSIEEYLPIQSCDSEESQSEDNYEHQAGPSYNSDEPGMVYNSDEPLMVYNSDEPGMVYNSDEPGMVYNSDEPGMVYNSDEPGMIYNSDDSTEVVQSDSTYIDSDTPLNYFTHNVDQNEERSEAFLLNSMRRAKPLSNIGLRNQCLNLHDRKLNSMDKLQKSSHKQKQLADRNRVHLQINPCILDSNHNISSSSSETELHCRDGGSIDQYQPLFQNTISHFENIGEIPLDHEEEMETKALRDFEDCNIDQGHRGLRGRTVCVSGVRIDAKYADAFFVKWNWSKIRRSCVFVNLSLLVALVCVSVGLVMQMPTGKDCEPGHEWWQGSTSYYIYVASFRDSNNDGVGDISGIIEKIPYIHSLGVKSVRLAPIFDWSQNDFNITPVLGNLKDIRLLSALLHEKDMKLVLDVPFFNQESLEISKENSESKETLKTKSKNLELFVEAIPQLMQYWLKFGGVDGFAFVEYEPLSIEMGAVGLRKVDWKNDLETVGMSYKGKVEDGKTSVVSNLQKNESLKIYSVDEKNWAQVLAETLLKCRKILSIKSFVNEKKIMSIPLSVLEKVKEKYPEQLDLILSSINLIEAYLDNRKTAKEISEKITLVTAWDSHASLPWINWRIGGPFLHRIGSNNNILEKADDVSKNLENKRGKNLSSPKNSNNISENNLLNNKITNKVDDIANVLDNESIKRCCPNYSDSHLSKFGVNYLPLFLPSSSVLYYGDEVGLFEADSVGWDAPMDWDSIDKVFGNKIEKKSFEEETSYTAVKESHMNKSNAQNQENLQKGRFSTQNQIKSSQNQINDESSCFSYFCDETLANLVHLIQNAADEVALYVNGLFESGGGLKKIENYKIRFSADNLLIIDRFYPRKTKFALILNLGAKTISRDLSSFYYGGTVLTSTHGKKGYVRFNPVVLSAYEALVITLDR